MRWYALCLDSQSCLWIPSEFNCWSISPCREKTSSNYKCTGKAVFNNIKVEKWAHSVQCKCQFCSLSHKVQSMGNSKYAIPMSTTQSHVKSNIFQRIPSLFVWVCLHVCLYVCHTIVLVIIEGKLLVLCLSLFHCFVPKTPRRTQRKPAFLEPHNCNLL